MQKVFLLLVTVGALVFGFNFSGNDYIEEEYFYPVDYFSQIDIDLGQAKVDFYPTEYDQIHVIVKQTQATKNENNIYLNETEDSLEIHQINYNNDLISSFGSRSNQVDIYIPESLTDLNVNVNGEHITLNVASTKLNSLIVNAQELGLSSSLSDIEILKVTGDSVSVKLNKTQSHSVDIFANTSAVNIVESTMDLVQVENDKNGLYTQTYSDIFGLTLMGDNITPNFTFEPRDRITLNFDYVPNPVQGFEVNQNSLNYNGNDESTSTDKTQYLTIHNNQLKQVGIKTK